MTQQQLETNQLINANGWNPANETWAYASADDPTYTFTISAFDATTKYSVGMKIKLTQSTGGTKYAFITKVVFDDPGSTITAYFGTDYNLENEAITLPYYSLVKAPFGFPLDPTKWTVSVTDTSNASQATPTQNVFYNLGSVSIDVPIGSWIVRYDICSRTAATSNTVVDMYITLSTANNSESDSEFSVWINIDNADACYIPASKGKLLTLTTKDTYYLIVSTTRTTGSALVWRGDIIPTKIIAVCAYL